MAKVYTAQEMLEAANAVDDVSINDNGEFYYEKHDKFNPDLIRDMLRQAADAMEREAQREKKYEYACLGRVFESLNDAMRYAITNEENEDSIVRREVGEWKEVKDEVQNS